MKWNRLIDLAPNKDDQILVYNVGSGRYALVHHYYKDAGRLGNFKSDSFPYLYWTTLPEPPVGKGIEKKKAQIDSLRSQLRKAQKELDGMLIAPSEKDINIPKEVEQMFQNWNIKNEERGDE